ncbi:MAG: hypothetical protein C0478_03565 [Planctomyces sp.]|nr:hypothetical protein [Planctomyces sp.]
MLATLPKAKGSGSRRSKSWETSSRKPAAGSKIRKASSASVTPSAPRPAREVPGEILYVDHPLFSRRTAAKQLEKLRPDSIASLEWLPQSAGVSTGALLPTFARSRLLLPTEENYLFMWMNFCRSQAEANRRRLMRSPHDEALWSKYDSWLAQGLVARNQIVQANLRLVVALSRKLSNSIDHLAELVSEGVMPLIRAVELFDVSLGNRFSTYATWAVRNQLHRSLKKAQNSSEFTAGHMEGGLEQFEDFRSPSQTSQTEAHDACQRELANLLETLTERERMVIAARYGLDGQPRGQSLSDISEKIGLSKERVRQIVLKALGKLKVTAEQTPVLVELCDA